MADTKADSKSPREWRDEIVQAIQQNEALLGLVDKIEEALSDILLLKSPDENEGYMIRVLLWAERQCTIEREGGEPRFEWRQTLRQRLAELSFAT